MMISPTIYVCESFANDYRKAAAEVLGKNIDIRPFPCLCCSMGKREAVKSLIFSDGNEKILLCGNNCPLLKDIDREQFEGNAGVILKTNDYCFHHFIDKKLIDYIVEKGGYIVTSGWLKSWKSRLAHDGFNQETARKFYQEFCNEIVFLDTHTENESLLQLIEFTEYIGIPYRIVDAGLDMLKLYLDKTMKEWQINGKTGLLSDINALRKEKAEYEIVLKIIEQITNLIQKRAIIDKVQELFRIVFGAEEITFLESGNHYEQLDRILSDKGDSIFVDLDEKIMMLRMGTQLKNYGILKVSNFLFPENINRYLSLAKSIVKVSSLAIDNAIQFEMIEKSRDEVAFLSNHDALTKLYNRNYFNKYVEENEINSDTAVFVCDIDGLKKVNDTLGHSTGDQLIEAATHVLSHTFRETDIIARVGGDEFYIIALNCTKTEALALKMRIQDNIEAYNAANSNLPYSLSISTGMYHSMECNADMSWEIMINKADEKMYLEKVGKKKCN